MITGSASVFSVLKEKKNELNVKESEDNLQSLYIKQTIEQPIADKLVRVHSSIATHISNKH